jgi:hypothetical protein
MEFSSRGLRPNERSTTSAAPAAGGVADVKGAKTPLSKKFKLGGSKGSRVLFFSLLIAATVLSVAAILLISMKDGESGYVNKDGYQVVALADKQVYFGKVTAVNDSYISITDVYYLNQSDSSDASNDVRLIKRGGEVHCPADRMTISRDQVNFWENIQPSGQIAKLIEEWKQKNPDGQACGTGATQQDTEATADDTDATTQESDTTGDTPATSTDDTPLP